MAGIIETLHDHEVSGAVRWSRSAFGGKSHPAFEVEIEGQRSDPLPDWEAVERWCADRHPDVSRAVAGDEELATVMNGLRAQYVAGELRWLFENAWHAQLRNGMGPEHVLEARSPQSWSALRAWLLERAQ